MRAKGSSPMGESQERGLDITDIHLAWDGAEDIRTRLRDGDGLMHQKTSLACDNGVCVLNASVLLPALCTMGGNPERKLPSVVDLRGEMLLLFRANKRMGPEVNQKVNSESIHIRKLLSFIKAKVRREEVSIAPFLRIVPLFYNFP